MTLHALVEHLRTAGFDVPAYHNDGAEWRIGIAVPETTYVTPYAASLVSPTLTRAIDVLRAAGHPAPKVQQDVETKEWELVLPARVT